MSTLTGSIYYLKAERFSIVQKENLEHFIYLEMILGLVSGQILNFLLIVH